MTKERVESKSAKVSRRKFVAVAAGTVAAGGVLGIGGLKLASAAGSPVKILVNGKAVNSSAARIIDSTTLVPVRFVSEELGAKVDWEQATKTVKITSETGIAVPPELPWPYVKLDPVEAARRAYEYYFTHGG